MRRVWTQSLASLMSNFLTTPSFTFYLVVLQFGLNCMWNTTRTTHHWYSTMVFLMVPTPENKSGYRFIICCFTSSLSSLILIGTGGKMSCCVCCKSMPTGNSLPIFLVSCNTWTCTDTCCHNVWKVIVFSMHSHNLRITLSLLSFVT